MKFVVSGVNKLNGSITVPGSKSHSIRGIIFASLAEGISTLTNVLESRDTLAAISACRILGAEINGGIGSYRISGFAGQPKPRTQKIDTMNSGTTTSIITSIAALTATKMVIDGDDSIRRRPVQPLLDSINELGGEARSINNTGAPPIEISSPMKGGKTRLNCRSSQYLSSLLISAPLLSQKTEIEVYNVCEKPYIEMTLEWLREQNIKIERNGYERFIINSDQKYNAFTKIIPADWSSATFFLVAGVLFGGPIEIYGLDINDTQADKKVLEYLKEMGGDIEVSKEKIIVRRSKLNGIKLDLNDTPDALPAMAVLAAAAEGESVIHNVAHARIKETDRIKVMTKELQKMGVNVIEKDDGMVIKGNGKLKGAKLNGHHDHRIVMALSIAAMIADGTSEIDTAEAVDVTVPGFEKLINSLGANIEAVK